MSRFVMLAAAVVAVGGSLFGYDAGVISGAILFVRQEFGLGTGEVELVVSAAVVGAMIGAITSGPMVDRFGLAVVPAAILGIGLVMLPDTPRWLLWRGKFDEARSALQRTRRCSCREQVLPLHPTRFWRPSVLA